jgi:small subunit ribosomal protein S18
MARNNYRGGTSSRRAPKDLGRRVKKKPCAMCRDQVEWVDYKDVPVLRKYMSDRGKIRSRRVTGNCAQHQRDIAQAIKLARELVLLPYTQRTVTEKPGGRGGRGDRGDRGDRPMGSGGFRGDRGPGGGDRGDRGAPATDVVAAVEGVPALVDGDEIEVVGEIAEVEVVEVVVEDAPGDGEA